MLNVCALESDLELLPAGDQTEIGERGINLSGGQKARVSLARAAYAQADVYLMDDVLSAVDVHVGKHIWEQCVQGFMKGSARLFVTHQLQYLPACDHILVMADGVVEQQGSFAELAAAGVDFRQFADEVEDEQDDDAVAASAVDVVVGGGAVSPLAPKARATSDASAGSRHHRQSSVGLRTRSKSGASASEGDTAKPGQGGQLMSVEDRVVGSVRAATFISYFRAAGGCWLGILLLFLFMIAQGCRAGADYWVSYWVQDVEDRVNAGARDRLGQHCGICFIATYC